ncbi:calcium/sodium antiporter [Tropicimonas sp. IMCC6043]|uniref:calcium/sodium antiporter n=1 Tax=Tropicimonas sp. IMCC6043 TaxID=2510645 RepID=UPI00101C9F86|nr:calcium/sodium antiporter [Tropicimonas sp. IMCC6043]RYH07297.1 calcium/sodium antiporter [Tropicimonas sp. IMCC6043]
MLTDIALLVLGLVILLLAGDALVKGAVNLALRAGVPALLVSLTIVAFGTSAPELLVSVKAILDGAPGIALGNVVGSNIANVLLVLGVPAMISVLHTSSCDTRKTYVIMMGATVVFIGLAYTDLFNWVDGMVLIFLLALMLADALRSAHIHRREVACAAATAKAARSAPVEEEEIEGADLTVPTWKIWIYLGLGLVGLPLGADILVDSAVSIAHELDVPETVIGLTLVALGTSLPELATTVMAAVRRQADVALGNVIGSNLFNMLAIIGIASFVGPIPVEPETLRFDIWVMFLSSAILFPFVFLNWDMGRRIGLLLTAAYVAYVWAVIA